MGRKKTLRSSAMRQEGEGSSSEDTEQQKTMNIINRLSKKYLKTSIKSDSEQQENRRRSRRLKSQNKSEPLEYDADAETSTGESSQSDASMQSTDLYDFDQSEEALRLELFPDESIQACQRKYSKASSKPQAKKMAKAFVGTSKKQKKVADKNDKKPEIIAKKRPLESRDNQTEQNLTKRRKVSPTHSLSSLSSIHSTTGSFSDSGVFLSPISRSLRSSLTPATTTTSTPAILIAGKHKQTSTMIQNSTGDISFGFDSGISPSPHLSPVRKIQRNDTPMDTGSPKLKTPIAERTYAHIVRPFSSVKKLVTSSVPSANEPKKKKSKKNILSTSKLDNWATKMNSEFDEIEMFELSIEG